MEPVKLGVIGCGVIGPTHMKAALGTPWAELVAVADLIEERAKAAAEKYGAPKTYIQGDDLIEDPDVEAVVLALPADGRFALAKHAFAAGKHVLTEKPVMMNAKMVEELIALRGDLTAGCASARIRQAQGAPEATALIASGVLGDLRVLQAREVRACGPKPEVPRPDWRLIKARNGGGILLNWGCYDLDYLLGLAGWKLKPVTVFAQAWTVAPQFESHVWPGSDAETHFVALIRCENGAVISFERGEYVAAASEASWRITGSKGSLKLNMLPKVGTVITHDDTSTEEGVVSREVWRYDPDKPHSFSSPAEDFCQAIRQGRQTDTSLERALVVQKISDAIYASAESGQAIHLD